MTTDKETVIVQGICTMCNDEIGIEANAVDVEEWQNGKLIQNAMPYLDTYDRESLITQTCRECLVKLYGPLS